MSLKERVFLFLRDKTDPTGWNAIWLPYWSFLLSFLFTWVALKDQWVTVIVMISLLVHEFGHALLITRMKVEFSMAFIPFFGAATSSDLQSRNRLSYGQNAMIAAMGPIASIVLAFVLIMIGIFLKKSLALEAAAFSAMIAVYNLLPISQRTDGGKMVYWASSSMNESEEIIYKGVLWLMSMAVIATLIVTGKFLAPIFMLTFLVGFTTSKKEDPEFDEDKQMSNIGEEMLLSLHFVLLIVSMFLVLSLPTTSFILRLVSSALGM